MVDERENLDLTPVQRYRAKRKIIRPSLNAPGLQLTPVQLVVLRRIVGSGAWGWPITGPPPYRIHPSRVKALRRRGCIVVDGGMARATHWGRYYVAEHDKAAISE
jgi:hypothetical protein